MNGLSDFDLLSLAEVADLLHCSKAHICNVIAGRVRGCPPIPSVSLGRRKLVRREALQSWIERSEHASADDNLRALANDNLATSPERGRKSA
jgi:hypothetical protein